MASRPVIYISGDPVELRIARQQVFNSLLHLGLEPVWQDASPAEAGTPDTTREKIMDCVGMIQLVGQRFGTEAVGQLSGRASVTHSEARQAQQFGKKIWYIVLADTYPADSFQPEPPDFFQLHQQYRSTVMAGEHHLVLVVQTSEGDFVLDNMAANVRPISQVRYKWVRAQQVNNQKFWSMISVEKATQAASIAR